MFKSSIYLIFNIDIPAKLMPDQSISIGQPGNETQQLTTLLQ